MKLIWVPVNAALGLIKAILTFPILNVFFKAIGLHLIFGISKNESLPVTLKSGKDHKAKVETYYPVGLIGFAEKRLMMISLRRGWMYLNTSDLKNAYLGNVKMKNAEVFEVPAEALEGSLKRRQVKKAQKKTTKK